MNAQYVMILLPILLLIGYTIVTRSLYWRVPYGVAYIRSGWGRPQVIFAGRVLVIPGIHRLIGMKMHNFTINAAATRKQSLLTQDPLRVDIDLRLLARIIPDADRVLIARSIFDDDIAKITSLLEQRCLSVMQTVAGSMPLESLLRNTIQFETSVHELLNKELMKLGVEVVLVSVSEIQQTCQLDYQRSKSIDAKALSILESMRSENDRVLHARLIDSEVQLAKLGFDSAMKQLEWDKIYATSRLEHMLHKLSIESRLHQDMKEIEVSHQLAIDVIEQDAARMRLHYLECDQN